MGYHAGRMISAPPPRPAAGPARRTRPRPLAFIARHLRGDYPLARAFWLHAVLPQAVLALLMLQLLPWLVDHATLRQAAGAALVCTLLDLLVGAWSLVGAWASANRHVARGGRPLWASAARIALVLGALRLLLDLVQFGPALPGYAKVAAGLQMGPPVTLQVRADGRSILLRGGINDGTAEALARALDAAPPTVRTVVLDSSGGWVRQGERIAEVITARQLDTYVEHECSSACTIAFMAGRQRTGDPAARLGFHSFHSVGLPLWRSGAANTERARNVYHGVGLSDAFLARVLATPPGSMWYPSAEELLRERVYTRISAGGETAALATDFSTRPQLVAEFMRAPVFAAIQGKYPQEFDAIVDQAFEQIRAGHNDKAVVAATRQQFGMMVLRLLPIVDDATLGAFNRLLGDEARALQADHPRECVAVLIPPPADSARWLPQELRDRDAQLALDIVRTSDPRNAALLPPRAEAEKAVGAILKQMAPERLKHLQSAALRQSEPVQTCAAVIAYLNAMNALPDGRRELVLRAIYAYR